VGLNLAPVLTARPLVVEDLRGQRLAIDGNNLLYQFLSSIRQADGQPLSDADGHEE